MPVTMLKRVVLPAPLGPMMPVMIPFADGKRNVLQRGEAAENLLIPKPEHRFTPVSAVWRRKSGTPLTKPPGMYMVIRIRISP